MPIPTHATAGTRSLRRARALSALIAIAVGLVLALMVEQLHRLESAADMESHRREILLHASALHARLESEFSASLFIADGTAELVSIYQDLLTPERIMTMLELIHRAGRHVRNVALAPNNVIRYIYPLEGNEAALGMDYRSAREQWPGVERAMREGQTILTGPETLFQGGTALIVRTPIVRADGQYWGMLSVVIDTVSLFAAVNLSEQDAFARVALRRIEATDRVRPIFGDAGVFEAEPVLLDVFVPGGDWQLGAVPRAGWSVDDRPLALFRAAGHALALIVTVLSFLVLDDRARAASAALHDPLTLLPNRRQLRRRLKRELLRAERSGGRLALLYVDLDGFKPINDRLGHGVGDRVLANIAAHLDSACGKHDFLARMGGDEFVALTLQVDTADALARRLEQAVQAAAAHAEDVMAAGLRLGASVGVSLYPDDGGNIVDLLHSADQRMYRQKKGNGAAR